MPAPVLTTEQMRLWENQTWEAGISQSSVIHQAGAAVARYLRFISRPKQSILILAGKGNNGADALHCQIHLRNYSIKILQIHNPVAQLADLKNLLKSTPDWVVDGLFGIGLNRPLSKEWQLWIETLNQSSIPILSIDIPSGLSADLGLPQPLALQATHTLTLGAPKQGLLLPSAAPYTGTLQVAPNIGLLTPPPSSPLQWVLPTDFLHYPPRRPTLSHKGTYGHLAILAGSLGYHGAAVLSTQAALQAQPGLISLFTPQEVYSVIAAQLSAPMVHPWESSAFQPERFSAILIGPGLAHPGLPATIRETFQTLWTHYPNPLIVDASALDWIPSTPCPTAGPRILTPHPGEASRLLSLPTSQIQADRPATLKSISSKYAGSWVVLKGHHSLSGTHQSPLLVNSSGNPHLAQGGSGDVLAGFLAGLAAQPFLQSNIHRLVAYSVWQHGATADRLQRKSAPWTSSDLARHIGGSPIPPL